MPAYRLKCTSSPCATRTTQRATRFTFHVLLLLILAGAGGRAPLVAAPALVGVPHYYPETDKTLAGEFANFYDAHGGLAVFGFPIEEAHREGNYLVQFCERARLEYHPEYAGTEFEVLLGRLGGDLTVDQGAGPFAALPPPAPAPAGTAYVPETGHTLGGAFLTYWQSHGAITLFGYPISEEFVEDGLRQQWFERARFEYHPDLPPDYQVTLGLLGLEAYGRRGMAVGQIQIDAAPARPRRLQLGLAQGGESQDPHFFGNVVPLIRELHVPLIRIDNIYTHYSVVGRDRSGRLTFHWDALDGVVDDILAMGAQPLMCLSYTPPVMSPDGSPIQPPTSLDEWQQLVTATVTHFNRDRALGLRYWEVWNEPEQWDFWRGSWPDYLTLYDRTRAALRAVDPDTRVGGPARGTYDAGALAWFLGHQAQQTGGGVDFLSWHAYGLAPTTVADQVGTTRNLLAAHPAFTPELAITEFNVATGGAGDTSRDHVSDTSAGAAYVLNMLDTLDRAGLDRAFLFEVKDGPGPAGVSYWGRWGITTHDGRPKPIYHALRAYQDLGTNLVPVQARGAGLGALAATPGGHPYLVAWNSGTTPTYARITVPPEWQDLTYDATLFDATHNNPAATGDDQVRLYGRRTGRNLAFTLAPGSVVLLSALSNN